MAKAKETRRYFGCARGRSGVGQLILRASGRLETDGRIRYVAGDMPLTSPPAKLASGQLLSTHAVPVRTRLFKDSFICNLW